MRSRLALAIVTAALLIAGATPVSAAEAGRLTIEGHSLFAGVSTFVAHGSGLCRSGTIADDTKVIDLNTVLVFDVRQTLTCDDGSGAVSLRVLARVHLCDQTDRGIWTITGGTGAYLHLRGAGTVVGTYFPGNSCTADGIDDHYTGVTWNH